MRKGLKRLVALVLSFSMVLGSAAFIFANEKPTVNYVSIGASNTNGYGLVGYLPDGVTAVMKDEANVFGYLRDPKGCYPDLFSRYLAGGVRS